MNSNVSVVIPTVRYSKYLDDTIDSALSADFDFFEIIVSINNNSSDGFIDSKFWRDERIIWKGGNYESIQNMDDSINNAIGFSRGDWVFMLSDDDLIKREFLKGVNFNLLHKYDLYQTRIEIIDETGQVLRDQSKIKMAKDPMAAFLKGKVQNHLSLFMFSRELYEKVGPYKLCGYPNGYYMDTVFHAKLIANSRSILVADKIVFSRRESPFQASAKFYIGSEINEYFDIIVETLADDENTRKEILKRYKTMNRYRDFLLVNRFKVETFKIYLKSFINKPTVFGLLLSCWRNWQLNFMAKLKITAYAFYAMIKQSLLKIVR